MTAIGSAVRTMVERAQADSLGCFLGVVASYSPTTRHADVDPIVRVDSGERLTRLLGVPVCWPGGGPFVVMAPLAAGDVVVVLVMDRDHDGALSTGDPDAEPPTVRQRDVSDALCIPLVTYDTDTAAVGSATDLVIGRVNGADVVRLTPGGTLTADCPLVGLGRTPRTGVATEATVGAATSASMAALPGLITAIGADPGLPALQAATAAALNGVLAVLTALTGTAAFSTTVDAAD